MRTPLLRPEVMAPVQAWWGREREEEEARAFLKRVNRWVGRVSCHMEQRCPELEVRGTGHVGRTASTSGALGALQVKGGEETQGGNAGRARAKTVRLWDES